MRQFWLSPQQSRAGISDGFEHHFGSQVPLRIDAPNEIAAHIWPETNLFFVNGYQLPIEKVTSAENRDRLQLATTFHGDSKAPVRFESVRVRKLTREPPPAESDYPARIAYYTESLQENPDDLTARYHRGLARMWSKQLEQAREDFDHALKLQPDVGMILMHRGLLAEYLEKHGDAVQFYERALKVVPDLLGAWRRLAWVLATSPDPAIRDGKKALQTAKQGCDLTKMRDYFMLLTLSAAHAELGQHDEAIAAAKKAATLAPDQNKQQARDFLARRMLREAERSESSAKKEPANK